MRDSAPQQSLVFQMNDQTQAKSKQGCTLSWQSKGTRQGTSHGRPHVRAVVVSLSGGIQGRPASWPACWPSSAVPAPLRRDDKSFCPIFPRFCRDQNLQTCASDAAIHRARELSSYGPTESNSQCELSRPVVIRVVAIVRYCKIPQLTRRPTVNC